MPTRSSWRSTRPTAGWSTSRARPGRSFRRVPSVASYVCRHAKSQSRNKESFSQKHPKAPQFQAFQDVQKHFIRIISRFFMPTSEVRANSTRRHVRTSAPSVGSRKTIFRQPPRRAPAIGHAAVTEDCAAESLFHDCNRLPAEESMCSRWGLRTEV